MIKSGFQYHNHTSYYRNKMTGHYLDWHNQPMVYKDYSDINPILLPRDVQLPGKKLSDLLKETDMNNRAGEIDRGVLSLILQLTYSLTAQTRHEGGDFYFRSVASAGALYPAEMYVAAHAMNGLDDGLYHFAIHRHALYPLRVEEFSSYLVRATRTPENRAPILTFLMSAIFFRSAWKYRERSYRYHLLDTGHLIENLNLALKALKLPFKAYFDFDEGMINHLLGVDESREVSLAVTQVFGEDSISDAGSQEIIGLPDEIKKASRVAGKETDYPAVREIHLAGTPVISGVKLESEMIRELGITPDTWTSVVFPSVWPETITYPDALFNRRSKRNFVKEPLRKNHMAALLESLCIPDSTHSYRDTEHYNSVSTGFLVGNAQDMSPGLYFLDPSK